MKKRKSNFTFFSFFKPTFNNFHRRIGHNLSQKTMLAGFLFMGVGLVLKMPPSSTLSFNGTVDLPVVVSEYTHQPTKIEISSISVILPIEQKSINKGVWEVSENAISHLATSSPLGSEGNVILYGHNTDAVLKKLHAVKIGDTITLKDKDGKNYTYKIYSIETVDPADMEALMVYKNQTVSIYTCTGFADLKRLLVKAERINYISAPSI